MSGYPDVAGIYAMLARTCPERRAEFRHRAHTTRAANAMRGGRRWSTHRPTGRTRSERTHWREQPRDAAGRFVAAEAS